jgi:serine/threonine protein kinase
MAISGQWEATTMQQQNPRMFGGYYQVAQVISTGPLLTMYTAYHLYSSDLVGLWVVELPPTVDEEAAERLLRVFEQRRRVNSPHVIHVYDWGVDERGVFIATDPPRGVTLRHVLETENLEVERALDLSRQMARGLVALQAQGVVDIDMRPQLVTVSMVGEQYRVQLDDIGLRLLLKQLGYMNSQPGGDIGYLDPRYAAPESLQNRLIGAASDVYQLGLLIYETIASRVPFVGRTAAETEAMQCQQPLPPITLFRTDTPQVVQDLLGRALAKDPAQRFPDAAALLQALENLPIGGIAQFSPAGGGNGGNGGEMADDKETVESQSVDDASTVIPAPPDTSSFNTDVEGALAYLYFEPEGEGPAAQRFAIKSNYAIVGRVDPKRGITPEIDLNTVDSQMTVSRQHARIRYDKHTFTIEDLKSRNKTRLRGLTLTPLQAEPLKDGDVVHFGSVRMVFRVASAKDATVVP